MDKLKQGWPFAAAGVVVTWLAMAFCGVWSAGGYRATLENAVEANLRAGVDHEVRLRAIERQLPEMAADVRWIRSRLEDE